MMVVPEHSQVQQWYLIPAERCQDETQAAKLFYQSLVWRSTWNRFQSGTGAQLASLCWYAFQTKIDGIKVTFSSLSPPFCSNLYEVLHLDGLRSLWWIWHLSERVQINMINTCFFPSTPILSLKCIMDIQIKIRSYCTGVELVTEQKTICSSTPWTCSLHSQKGETRVCLAQGNGLVTHNSTYSNFDVTASEPASSLCAALDQW